MSNKSFRAVVSISLFFISLAAGVQVVDVTNANPIGGFYPSYPPPAPVIAITLPENNSVCLASTVALRFNVTVPPWTSYFLLDNNPNHIYPVTYLPITYRVDDVVQTELDWNGSEMFIVDLRGLGNGEHSLEVNASVSGDYLAILSTNPDHTHNMGIANWISNSTSGKIFFSIDEAVQNASINNTNPTPAPSPTPSRSPSPILSSSPTPTVSPTSSSSPIPTPAPITTTSASQIPTPKFTPPHGIHVVIYYLLEIIIGLVMAVVAASLIYFKKIKKQK